ncbi:MAG: Membrane protein [Candidatus Magasanikbacteria bacterium GW2011_GWA2_56_11]|uniref:Membrane protein n=1 Tax=Candidatus Magasanikbacteria bacterium GW2011_GWA2_56_11 TaxID=1619044 RepID=A0A0G2AL45_9BACT|nr:MAG: Membrane protein [Candidatus Magasanikbacteria bacterium GW2011_GWA2_56_11]
MTPAGTRRLKSARTLVYANLIPLLGVVLLRWNVLALLYAYWWETAVIGFYTVLKMLRAEAVPDLPSENGAGRPDSVPARATQTRVFATAFFILHFSGFLFVYWFFLFQALPALIGALAMESNSWADRLGLLAVAVGFLVSHGLSYQQNFIEGGEYKRRDFISLMFAPYKRIIILHFTILIGVTTVGLAGFSLTLLLSGQPPFLKSILHSVFMAIFIAIKIMVDKKFHIEEHARTDEAISDVPA